MYVYKSFSTLIKRYKFLCSCGLKEYFINLSEPKIKKKKQENPPYHVTESIQFRLIRSKYSTEVVDELDTTTLLDNFKL